MSAKRKRPKHQPPPPEKDEPTTVQRPSAPRLTPVAIRIGENDSQDDANLAKREEWFRRRSGST